MNRNDARPPARILEKIKTLLAIGHSTGSQAECENALQMAERMMRKYAISMVDVAAAEVDAGWSTGTLWSGVRQPVDCPFVIAIVDEFFFVQCYRESRYDPIKGKRVSTLRMFGTAAHVAVARYVYVYLTRTFRALWDAQRKTPIICRVSGRVTHLKRGDARNYYAGLAIGLTRALRQQRAAATVAERNALIRVGRQAAEALAAQGIKLVTRDFAPLRGSDEALAAGVERGKQINIRQPLPAADNTRKIECR